MRRALLFFALLVAGCTSSLASRPKDIPQPTIQVRQEGSIYFGSGMEAAASIDIEVTNNAKVPLLIKEVEVSSPGMAEYTIVRTSKLFNDTVEPGQSRVVGLVATAIARDVRRDRYEPLSLRAVIRFEAEGKAFREIVFQHLAGEGAQ